MRRCYGCMEEFSEELTVCPHCGYVVGTEAEEPIFMMPGTKLRDRYTIGRTIGFGGFGATYIGWDEVLEQRVAIKEYLPGEFSTRMPGKTEVKVFNGEKTQQFHDGMKEFVGEAKRLAKFQNEKGIVKIFDSFEENNTAYIIMEYLEGETLTEYLKHEGIMNEDDAVALLTPVMESLKKVHEEGLLHRDIASDNIFITKDGEVKLIDFGAARYATTSHSRSLTVIVKPGYSPEEQYRSRGDQGTHTDVYALAATLYKMMTGKTPPDALERRAKYESKSQDLLISPKRLNKSISKIREVALLNALNVRIEDRTPDIDSFLEELNAEEPAKRIYGKLKKIDLYTWPMWLKGAIIASIIGIIALVVWMLFNPPGRSEGPESPPGYVKVPDVEGLKSEKAIKEIEKSGLTVATEGNVESEHIEAGKIVYQDPSAGIWIKEEGTVSLTISSGKKIEVNPEDDKIVIPYVIWDTVENAKKKLTEAGFTDTDIIIKEEYDESVTEGQVITTSIKAGKEVKKGTSITLTISKGRKEEPGSQEGTTQGASTPPQEPGSGETWGTWTYGSWITTKAATCTEKGEQTRTKTSTSNKGNTQTEKESRTIEALGHAFSQTTSGNYYVYTCSRCGHTETKPITDKPTANSSSSNNSNSSAGSKMAPFAIGSSGFTYYPDERKLVGSYSNGGTYLSIYVDDSLEGSSSLNMSGISEGSHTIVVYDMGEKVYQQTFNTNGAIGTATIKDNCSHQWTDIIEYVNHPEEAKEEWVEDSPARTEWYVKAYYCESRTSDILDNNVEDSYVEEDGHPIVSVSFSFDPCGTMIAPSVGPFDSEYEARYSREAEDAFWQAQSHMGQHYAEIGALIHIVFIPENLDCYSVEIPATGHFQKSIVSKAYTEEIKVGQKCSICGAIK